MDPVSLQRAKFMHPCERDAFIKDYNYVNSNILGKGVRCRLAYVLRTDKEQNALYALGRTVANPDGKTKKKPLGNIVTNAKGGQSVHCYGLAFDIVILYDLNGDGTFETASWDMLKDHDKDGEADWMAVVNYFKSKGWTWGGDWSSFKDNPHLQKDHGMSWKTMKYQLDKGNYTKEIIEGKEYKWIHL